MSSAAQVDQSSIDALTGSIGARRALEPGESGPARVTIERFDPFAGWLFARRVSTTIVGGTGSVSFRPTLGRWRARAEYLGSRTAEPSQTRSDVHFGADTPLEP